MNLERIWSLVEYWEASGRAAETSGRIQAGTEASRYSGGSRKKSTSSGRMILGLFGRPNGMARRPYWWNSGQMGVRMGWHDRPYGWQGTKFFELQTVQNLLEALLNSGIPVKQHHYNEVILSNRMWPITNQQIPKTGDQFERKHTQHNMIEQTKSSVCVWQRKQKARVWTWYILVRTACCQIRDRQSRARPDARTCPSGRFRLEAEK
jgi:hypothetical protein